MRKITLSLLFAMFMLVGVVSAQESAKIWKGFNIEGGYAMHNRGAVNENVNSFFAGMSSGFNINQKYSIDFGVNYTPLTYHEKFIEVPIDLNMKLDDKWSVGVGLYMGFDLEEDMLEGGNGSYYKDNMCDYGARLNLSYQLIDRIELLAALNQGFRDNYVNIKTVKSVNRWLQIGAAIKLFR
ncbi:MAG: hypothetical protein R3Y50_08660 [Rikenellaceae bacterium]